MKRWSREERIAFSGVVATAVTSFAAVYGLLPSKRPVPTDPPFRVPNVTWEDSTAGVSFWGLPSVSYATTDDNQIVGFGRLITVAPPECSERLNQIGTVIDVHYVQDQERIYAFVVKNNSGDTLIYNIDPELPFRTGRAQSSWLSEIISKHRRVSIDYLTCGRDSIKIVDRIIAE